MGYVINIDIDQLKKSAKELKRYVSDSKGKNNKLIHNIYAAQEFWDGEDYVAFKNVWNLNYKVLSEMNESISNISDYLDYSYREYWNMQSRLKNRVKFLPK